MNKLQRSKCVARSGFTLAELMVAVAIIGILSAATISISGNEWKRERVNAVAQQLAGWLEEVRAASLRETNIAIGSGGCKINFSTGTSLLPGAVIASIDTAVSPSCVIPQASVTIGSASSESTTRFDTAVTTGTVIFTPRGTSNNSADLVYKVFLQGSTLLRCVRISPTLGMVSIGSNNSAASSGDSCGTYGAF